MPSILDQAKPIDEYPAWFKGLIYGEGGTRKTTFASDAPNPLWMEFGKDAETLRYLPGKNKIHVLRPRSLADIDAIIKEFIKSEKYETLVVDTATRMQLFQLSEQMVQINRTTPSRDRWLPFQADYRKSGNIMDDIFARLQDAEKHVIINAHRKVFIDPDTKRITAILPDLTPRLKDAVAGLVNMVAYVEMKTGTGNNPPDQVMHFVSAGKFFAKNRYRLVTDQTNPTFDSVFTTKGN